MRGTAARLVVAMCAAARLVGAANAGEPSAATRSLDEANRRWRGAHCRLREDHLVKPGRDADGWSTGPWVWLKRPVRKYRLRVSDATALQSAKKGSLIPAGTELISEGWRLIEAESGKGLVLDLRLAESSAIVRFAFYGSYFGTLSTEHLPEVERQMRFEILDITQAGDEVLTAESAAPTGAAAAPTLGPPAEVGPGAAAPLRAGLRLVAASVDPARATAGDEVRLRAAYLVENLGRGEILQVIETRTIVRDGESVVSFEATVGRGAGMHESSQPVRLPAGLTAGVYELRVSLRAAGAIAEGSAIFEVTGDRP